jgi:hypothetical protein
MFKITIKYLIAFLLSALLINFNASAFHKEGNSEKHIKKIEGKIKKNIQSQYCTQQVEEFVKTVDITNPEKKKSDKEQTIKERLEEIEKENSEEILAEIKKETVFIVSSYHASKVQEAPKELDFSVLKNKINKNRYIGGKSTIETLLNFYCVQELPGEGKSKKFKSGNKKLYDEIAAINGYKNRESKIEGDIFDRSTIFLSIEEKTLIYAKAQFILDEELRLEQKAKDDAEQRRIDDEKKAIQKAKDDALKDGNEQWISKNKQDYLDSFNKKLDKYETVISKLEAKRNALIIRVKDFESVQLDTIEKTENAIDDLVNTANQEIKELRNEIRQEKKNLLIASDLKVYKEKLKKIKAIKFNDYARYKTLKDLIKRAKKSNKAKDFVGKDGHKIKLPKIAGGGTIKLTSKKIGFIQEFKNIENKELDSNSDAEKIKILSQEIENHTNNIDKFVQQVTALTALDEAIQKETPWGKYAIYFVIFLVIVGVIVYVVIQQNNLKRIRRESEEKVGSLKSDFENKLKDTSEQIKSVSRTAAAARSQQSETSSIPEPVEEIPKTPEEIIAAKYDELLSDYKDALDDFSKVAVFKQKWNGLALNRKERQDGSKTILISASRAFEKSGIWCVSFDDKYFAFPGSTVKSNMATYMNMDFMKAGQDFKGVFGVTTSSTYSSEPSVLRKSGAGYVVERVGKIAFPD